MTLPSHPQIRALELVPIGEGEEQMFALRDPYGFAGTVALPLGAAMLVTLMNGQRSLGQLRQEFEKQVGKSLTFHDVERVVQQLDEGFFLDNDRFAAHESAVISDFKQLDIRPAAHAGGAYEAEPDALRAQLAKLFTHEEGPGLLPWEGGPASGDSSQSPQELCGVMSPHIDLRRGGPAFAWAYDRVVTESDAELFVILGTAHTPLGGMFSVSRKHFDTPLGTASTDREFIDTLSTRLAATGTNGAAAHMFEDEFPHRNEHSIEFQALLLQYVLGGRREYSIVPILVGSFHQFVMNNRSPGDFPAVSDFVAALRATAAASKKKVCFIAGVDLAHIGQQFGDEHILSDERLAEQWTDDQYLLAAACEGDAEGWFVHVAAQGDRNRICGLAPMYTMLRAIDSERGELLKYDQAVADDCTSCVSFAAAAFYR